MHLVKVISHSKENHDSFIIKTEKPSSYEFVPGHSVFVSLPNYPKRAFTIISRPTDNFLEFLVKLYPEPSITQAIAKLKTFDTLELHEKFGTHRYTRPSLFIAAGVGIAPFIAIFRSLTSQELSKSRLLCINKTESDILLKSELESYFSDKINFMLTRENKSNYLYGHITSDLIKKINPDNLPIEVCGPWDFMQEVKALSK